MQKLGLVKERKRLQLTKRRSEIWATSQARFEKHIQKVTEACPSAQEFVSESHNPAAPQPQTSQQVHKTTTPPIHFTFRHPTTPKFHRTTTPLTPNAAKPLHHEPPSHTDQRQHTHQQIRSDDKRRPAAARKQRMTRPFETLVVSHHQPGLGGMVQQQPQPTSRRSILRFPTRGETGGP